MKIRLFILVLFIACSYTSVDAQSPKIDSLEAYAKTAKPGWDQIDMSIGLGRLYLGGGVPVEIGNAEIRKLDSLAEVYNIPSAKAYAMILRNIRAYIYESDADAAIAYCHQAIEIARATNNQDALVYASYQLAENYTFEKGEDTKAQQLLESLLDELDESVSLKNQGHVHKNLGYVNGLLGNYDLGLYHLNIALEIFKGIEETPPIDPRLNRVSAQLTDPLMHAAIALNYIGDLHLKKGESDRAIKAKEEALAMMHHIDLKTDIAWMNKNLSTLHTDLGDYKTALEYVQQARLLYQELDLMPEMVAANTTMAGLYMKLGDLPEAEALLSENLDYYRKVVAPRKHISTLLQMVDIQVSKGAATAAKAYLGMALTIVNQIDDSNHKGMVALASGKIAMLEKDAELAARSFLSAVGIFEQVEDEVKLAETQYLLAKVYLSLEYADSAKVLAMTTLKKAEDMKYRELIRDSHLLISDIYKSEGDYQAALSAYERYYAFNDSLYTADAQAKLKEEQVRQNIVNFQREKELAEQNASLLEAQNTIFTVVGAVLLLILLMMAYLYMNLRKVKNKVQLQNEQLTQLNQTKDKFFAIIAHDLRSPLIGLQNVSSQIAYYLKKKKLDKLDELGNTIDHTSKKLTDLLDNLLNWALLQNGMIPYKPEPVNLKDVVRGIFELLTVNAEIKKVRLETAIDQDTFVYADYKAVQTILRNIIANALKYTEEGGQIIVNTDLNKDKCIITINDTGTGISAEMIPKLFEINNESRSGTRGEKGSGLGLMLCKELVELNKGAISVESSPGVGSKFTFHLPKYNQAA